MNFKIGRKPFILLFCACLLATAGLWLWFGRFSESRIEKVVPDSPKYPENIFPPDVLAALPDATSWTLLALEPRPRKKTADEFHGYPVIGRLPLEDATVAIPAIQEIATAGSKWTGYVVLCFDPRHGLSAELEDGRIVDFVICYHCSEALLYVDEKGPVSVYFGGTEPHPSPDRLNQLLEDNDIPMSAPPN